MLSWFRGFVITEPLVWSASWWSWGATGPTWALMAWCCLCCSQPRLPSAFLYHCRLTWTFYPPSNMLILSGRRVTSLWCSGPCHVSGGPTLYFASLSASASPLRWRIPLRIRNVLLQFQHQGSLRQEDQEMEACLVYTTRSVSSNRSRDRVRLIDYPSVSGSVPVR